MLKQNKLASQIPTLIQENISEMFQVFCWDKMFQNCRCQKSEVFWRKKINVQVKLQGRKDV